MRKGRIKSPCVSLECIIRIEVCGGKNRFSHAIAANKRANSHNFKTKKLNLLTNTFLADYLMNRGKSSYMNNHLWKWIILSVRSLTVFEEKIALTVLAKLASLFFKNVHALFLFLRVNFIAWHNQNPSTPLLVMVGLKVSMNLRSLARTLTTFRRTKTTITWHTFIFIISSVL